MDDIIAIQAEVEEDVFPRQNVIVCESTSPLSAKFVCSRHNFPNQLISTQSAPPLPFVTNVERSSQRNKKIFLQKKNTFKPHSPVHSAQPADPAPPFFPSPSISTSAAPVLTVNSQRCGTRKSLRRVCSLISPFSKSLVGLSVHVGLVGQALLCSDRHKLLAAPSRPLLSPAAGCDVIRDSGKSIKMGGNAPGCPLSHIYGPERSCIRGLLHNSRWKRRSANDCFKFREKSLAAFKKAGILHSSADRRT